MRFSSWGQRLAVAIVVLLSAGMLTSAAVYLTSTASDARARILADFDARPVVAAKLIASTLSSSDAKTRALGSALFSGSAAEMREAASRQVDLPAFAVLRADDGRVLLHSPASFGTVTRGLVSNDGYAIARQTGRLAFGGMSSDGTKPGIPAFQPYDSPGGARVLVLMLTVDEVSVTASGALTDAGVTSYLIDREGRVILAPGGTTAGVTLPDTALLKLTQERATGTVGGRYISSQSVAGTNWRVVMTTSRSELLRPVQSTGRVAWQLFAALTGAILIMLLIGAAALTGATRLAHARLHDTLTGLPGRALFLQQADGAIGEWRRKRQGRADGSVAALFLDLDGFKPVNDTYGHAAGDDLLRQVAIRLVDATRPDDFVCRFGGDEFQVFCRGLRSEDDAYVVAENLRRYLSEPFEVAGHTVRIGVSIGIATPDSDNPPAETLFRNADIALYQAKTSGRGRVVQYNATMADALS